MNPLPEILDPPLLLLFIHCLLLLPLWVEVLSWVLVFNGLVLGILSSLAIILLMKRELVALLSLCCVCVSGLRLSLTVTGVGLQSVIAAFRHSHFFT